MSTFTLCARTASDSETRALGEALSALLQDGDLVVLSGDLGAGKTRLTQGIALGLGIEDRITSPTFTLANCYQGRLELNHLDVYRLGGFDDSVDLDLPELTESGVTVIEWGERVEEALASSRLSVAMRFDSPDSPDYADDTRILEMELMGTSWQQRSQALKKVLAEWLEGC